MKSRRRIPTIAIASDHRGYALRQVIARHLRSEGYLVRVLGSYRRKAVDYPDVAVAMSRAMSSGQAQRGILICGSGVGMTIAANRLHGLRACACSDVFSAHQGVEHDDMNVLVLGAWIIAEKVAQDLVDVFVRARFDRAPRHLRRLEKVKRLSEIDSLTDS